MPLIANGSAEFTAAPTSSVAPLDTVVVERVEPDSPSAAAFVIRVVPAVILVEPVYVFAFVSTKVPEPPLVTPYAPEMTPEIVPETPSTTCTFELASSVTVPDRVPEAV